MIIKAIQQCYIAWGGMHRRTKPVYEKAEHYYSKGITVCDMWSDPLEFIRWSLENGFAIGLSMNRIDNDGNYSPENCQWATRTEHSQNRSITKLSMEKAREIRAIAKYFYQRELGEIYGVPQQIISGVIRNKRWKESDQVDYTVWGASDKLIEDIIRLYDTWGGMKQRVTPGYKEPQYYYDKGITICKEWYDFVTFASWALDNGYTPELTIDRIDNGDSYYPENCRWATDAEQNQNRSNTVLDWNKVGQIKDICEQTGLSYRDIGKIYGVSRHLIGRVRRNEIWKNI